MKSIEISKKDIILRVEQAQQDMYFLSGDHKYQKLYLWSTEQDEYYIKDDPIPESLSPWVELTVLKKKSEGHKSLDLSCKWHGLKLGEEKMITDVIRQVHLALDTGTSLSVNLKLIFNPSVWVPRLE